HCNSFAIHISSLPFLCCARVANRRLTADSACVWTIHGLHARLSGAQRPQTRSRS
ncbi:unnamed protein product, partial [Tilletia laevis]